MKQDTPVRGGHGQVGLVLADDHVVDVLVGEFRFLLLAGDPAALLAPAKLGAWRELPQFRHRCPVAILLLGLPRICSGILLDPVGLLRRFLRPLLRNPGRLRIRHLGKPCVFQRELRWGLLRVQLQLRLRLCQTLQRLRRLLRGRNRDVPGGVSNVLGDVCTVASVGPVFATFTSMTVFPYRSSLLLTQF
jgi:hypothetical protein